MKALIWLIVSGTLVFGLEAGPAIGIVTARGSFRLDQARVSGNGTLFDGTVVETEGVPSELQLDGGVKMLLAAGSRGAVYRDRVVLERGRMESAGQWRVVVAGLQASPRGPAAKARFTWSGPGRVQVAALSGALRMADGRGLVIATIPAGKALDFERQAAGAAAPSELTGALEKQDGHYLLKDETANITVELRGSGLEKDVGKRVRVTGTVITAEQPAAGATQLIAVTTITVLGKKAPAGAVAGTGMTLGTKAIIGGVVIAAAATGTAVGLTRGEDKTDISR